jgi:hypothetical protein
MSYAYAEINQLQTKSTETAKLREVIIQNKICIFLHIGLPFNEVKEKNACLYFRTFIGFRWHTSQGVSFENSVKVLSLKFAIEIGILLAYLADLRI